MLAGPILLGGCAGSALDTSMLGPATAALKLPDAPDLSKIELPKPADPIVGTPTEVYERIGHGAVTCWFGAQGPLKGTYIYEASADSPHKGGQAEIAIREKDTTTPNPRSTRAYRISIRPEGEDKASVEAENIKLPEQLADKMKRDVENWGAGKTGCEAGDAATTATAPTPPPAAPTKPGAPAKPSAPAKPAGQSAAAAGRVASTTAQR